jgi:hypothetical protein
VQNFRPQKELTGFFYLVNIEIALSKTISVTIITYREEVLF